MEKKKIVVADAGEDFRRILVETINKESDLAVVGETADGEEAVSLCAQSQCEVMVMDMVLSTMDGVVTLYAVNKANNAQKIKSCIYMSVFA